MPNPRELLPPVPDPRPEAEKLLSATVLDVDTFVRVTVPSLSNKVVEVEHWSGSPTPGDLVLVAFDETGSAWLVATSS